MRRIPGNQIRVGKSEKTLYITTVLGYNEIFSQKAVHFQICCLENLYNELQLNLPTLQP